MAKNKKVKADETPQERFRRVANQRTIPLMQRINQLTTMIGQPSYDPSEQDLKNLKKTVNDAVGKLNVQIERALSGEVKKEDKKFDGINWDEQPSEDESGSESESDSESSSDQD